MTMETEPADLKSQQAQYNNMRPFLESKIIEASIEIYNTSGFEISAEGARPFVDFVRWINTRPQFISEWRSEAKTEQTLYPRFMIVSGGVRSAYAAVCYHLMRIKEIEASVDAILSKYDFSSQFNPNQTASFGNMRQLDFEYHAFVIAYRRCLDYLSWGFSAYFKQSQNSYNKFKKTLERAHPRSVAEALIAVYEKHIGKFSFVIGTERGQSLRDRIGHSEFVQAATINVGSNGHRFVGGGENLRISDPNDDRSFSEILDSKAHDLHKCISEFLYSFQDSVISFENTLPIQKFNGPLSTQHSYYNVDNRTFYLEIAKSWKIS
ncbi:hypothetical protein [Acetobacter sp.]|uniref:hypothetical protein n=1 Tax=Acetobacter sp. TaxID=440 RepID=UPI0025BA5640|nr:hypothetical protein [Acetobacter sp.]MCH4091050.1 hypothetical protein [Acetobacter sp.]MCI1300233.1 hypothetical protein [Acetobacter sp.]MCI1316099.1 hypothetical protein [Acetobacter sp.]